jgi:hypothetical protein
VIDQFVRDRRDRKRGFWPWPTVKASFQSLSPSSKATYKTPVDVLAWLVGVKVDPIVWTKNERSFATPMQVCLTRNCKLHLRLPRPYGIALAPGETEVGSAGEHPAKG